MGVFRATVRWTFAAGAGVGTNSWALRTTELIPSTATLDNLMGIVKRFYTVTQGHRSSSTVLSWDGTVSELGNPSPALVGGGTPWTLTGTGAANSYGPAPAMVCVTWRTPLASRSGRGRTFLGPNVPGIYQADGTLTTTALGEYRSAAQTLVAESAAATGIGAIAVWSKSQSIARDVVASSVTDQVAVLRSRRG